MAKWSDEEDAALRKHYPHLGAEAFRARHTPHRSMQSVTSRAKKLGVSVTEATRRANQRQVGLRRQENLPTPKEIATRAAEIRAQWPESIERARGQTYPDDQHPPTSYHCHIDLDDPEAE